MQKASMARLTYPVIFIGSCLLVLFQSGQFAEPDDAKYLVGFGLFFVLLLSFFYPRKSDSPLSDVPRLLLLLLLLYASYLFVNWRFLSVPYYGLRGMAYQWLCLLAFGIVAIGGRDNSLVGPAKVVATCGAISSLYALAEFLMLVSTYRQNSWPPAISGLMGHKNPFAIFLIWGICAALYMVWKSDKKKWRILWIFTVAVQSVGLLISDTRGAIVLCAVALAAILIPYAVSRGWFKTLRNRVLLYAGLLLLVILPLIFWSDEVMFRFAKLLVPAADGSAMTRVMLYKAEWEVFLRQPWFGCGIGNFVHFTVPFWPKELRMETYNLFPRNAESDYMETLVETGVVGLAFYLVLLFGAAILGIRQLRKGWSWGRYILLVLFIIMLINGIYDTALRRLPLALLLWGTAGFFWAQGKRAARIAGSSLSGKYLGIGVVAIHLMVAFLLVRLLMADYHYNRWVSGENKGVKSDHELMRAYSWFPDQPDVLFHIAFLTAQTANRDYALTLANRIDTVAPYYRPTNFVRALVAFQKDSLDSALTYANKEIYRNPWYTDAYQLKVATLGRLGRCAEMKHLRDSVSLPLLNCDANLLWYDTVSEPKIRAEYLKSIGKARALMGGAHLYQAYKNNLSQTREVVRGTCDKLTTVAAMRCAPQPDSVKSAPYSIPPL